MGAVDFAAAEVVRLKDKSSPVNRGLIDFLRSKYLLRKKQIVAGKHVTVKPGVQIDICNSGELLIGDNTYIHSFAWLLLTMPHPVVKIGKCVDIGRYTVIASKNSVSIGDFSIIAPKCYLVDHEHGFEASDIIHNQRSVLKRIDIGKDCYLGTGTIVLGGVTIGDGAVIGAGSVVTKSIPAYEFWAGNPARFLKKRR